MQINEEYKAALLYLSPASSFWYDVISLSVSAWKAFV